MNGRDMRTFMGLLALVALGAGIGCSNGDGSRDRADGAAGFEGGVVFGDDSGLGDGGTGGGNGDAAALLGDGGEACAATRKEGNPLPLDIYVMFDQSGSMLMETESGDKRIEAVRQAVKDFLADPNSEGLGVGIGYFGDQMIGSTSCDPADYETPDVPIAPLPGNRDAIEDSVDSVSPTGETPTGAAIRGACRYTQQWKEDHEDHVVVNLFVTDGNPEAPQTSKMGGCEPTLEDAVMAATDCATSSPGIPTYVLGVGSSLDNLNQIAQAGETDEAHLVSGQTNVASEVLQALNQIRGEAVIPCELQLPEPPEGETLDLMKVNVVYGMASGDEQVVPYVETQDNCDSQEGGWYYDEPPPDSSRIVLCDATCSEVSGATGELDVALGCATEAVK